MNQTDPTAAIHLSRDQLAALLAHHADVLAANLRTDGTTGLPENSAGIKRAAELLDLHAEHLTAETECAPVTELLDSILAFPAYREAWLTSAVQQPAAVSAVVSPPTSRAAVLLEAAAALTGRHCSPESVDIVRRLIDERLCTDCQGYGQTVEDKPDGGIVRRCRGCNGKGLRRLADEAQQQPDTETPTDQGTLRDRIAEALEREDAHNAGYDHGFCSQYGVDSETDGFVDAVLAVLLGPIPQDANTATWTAIRAIQLMNEASREREEHRLALSQALGLGTGAPWEAIHERVTVLRRLAGEQPAAEGACQTPDYVDGPCHCPGCDPNAHRPQQPAAADDEETRCTCADAGDCFAPAGHYADCPLAEPAPPSV
ncbi:hypothetical protein ABZT16_11405 [Streptomyces flaveolus]|uniref:hypothetical protein n=1 Tax=Streptomyces flaveolus TaxID=67297 RepID=UPI0033BC89D6